MKLNDYKKYKLMNLFDIERAKKGKQYNAGDIIIQVSATRGQIFYLEEDTEVESKYAVLKVKKEINTKYIYYILEKTLPTFLKKYQTDINIQPEIFKYLEIEIHNNLTEQNYIANLLTQLDKQIEYEEREIQNIQGLKKYHLSKMFI